MKKLIVLTLVLTLSLLAACDDKGETDQPTPTPTSTPAPASTPTPSPAPTPTPDSTPVDDAPVSGIDALWELLGGVWKLTDDTFYIYFGYDYESRPIYFFTMGYETSEHRYPESVDVEGVLRSVTYYVPEYDFTDGLFDPHDAFYESFVYDLSGLSEGKLTSTFENGTVSFWEYAGETFDAVHGTQD